MKSYRVNIKLVNSELVGKSEWKNVCINLNRHFRLHFIRIPRDTVRNMPSAAALVLFQTPNVTIKVKKSKLSLLNNDTIVWGILLKVNGVVTLPTSLLLLSNGSVDLREENWLSGLFMAEAPTYLHQRIRNIQQQAKQIVDARWKSANTIKNMTILHPVCVLYYPSFRLLTTGK